MQISLSLVQMAVTPLDKSSNLKKIAEHIKTEAGNGSQLIVFPELSNTGYIEPIAPGRPIGLPVKNSHEYANLLWENSDSIDGNTINELSSLADKHNIYIVAGLALRYPDRVGKLYNSSVLIGPGNGLIGAYDKLHLWACEKLYFATGDAINTYETGLAQIGMQVCYDIRFPEITRIMALQGAEIITNVWASSYPVDNLPDDMLLFHHRCYTRAHENGVYFISCNQSGEQSGYKFLGRSLVCGPDGNIIDVLNHDYEDVLRVNIDMNEISRYRNNVSLYADRRPDIYNRYLNTFK